MDEFLRQAIGRVDQIRHEIQVLDAEIAPLQAKRDGLERAGNALYSYIKAVQEKDQAGGADPEEPTSLDMIERVMREVGGPLHYRQIFDHLRDRYNYNIGGQDPLRNLSAKLAGARRFRRFGDGVYGLAEWADPAWKEPEQAD